MPVTTIDAYDPETTMDQFAIVCALPPGEGSEGHLYLEQWYERGAEKMRWNGDLRCARKFRTAADAAEFIDARTPAPAVVPARHQLGAVAIVPVRTPIT